MASRVTRSVQFTDEPAFWRAERGRDGDKNCRPHRTFKVSSRLSVSSLRGRLPASSGGKGKAEAAALVRPAFDGQLPAVALDHALGEIEAVTRTFTTRLIQLHPDLENLPCITRVDPDAVVNDTNSMVRAFAAVLDRYFPVALLLIREDESVRNQSAESLAQLLRIGVDGRKVLRDVDRHASTLDQVVVFQADLLSQFAQIHGSLRIGTAEKFDDMRHLIEDSLHLLGAGTDALKKVAAIVVEPVLVIRQKKLAEAVNGENRRLQIMRQNAEQPDQLFDGCLVTEGLVIGSSLQKTTPKLIGRLQLMSH